MEMRNYGSHKGEPSDNINPPKRIEHCKTLLKDKSNHETSGNREIDNEIR